MDPCASSSERCAHRAFLGLLSTVKKKCGQIEPQLVATHVGTLTRNERLRENAHDNLNSVLEQALVTPAVGEAQC